MGENLCIVVSEGFVVFELGLDLSLVLMTRPFRFFKASSLAHISFPRFDTQSNVRKEFLYLGGAQLLVKICHDNTIFGNNAEYLP